MRYWSTGRIAALAALLLFVFLFVLLSVDIVARLWAWRAKFESPLDLAFLFYLEGLRSAVTLMGIVMAVVVARRVGVDPARGALAFGLAFATLAYTKLFGFSSFPGAVQSAVSFWLREHGVSSLLLAILFGHWEWTVWPALAGFGLFAAGYPRALTADDVERSGGRDRRGALRSVAGVGTDIGKLSRDAAAGLLHRRVLRGRVLWPAALVCAVIHTAAVRAVRPPLPVQLGALALATVVCAVLIALLRASYHVAGAEERVSLRWLRRGALASAVPFAAGALTTLLAPDQPIGAMLLSLGPAPIAVCWLIAVLRLPRGVAIPEPALVGN